MCHRFFFFFFFFVFFLDAYSYCILRVCVSGNCHCAQKQNKGIGSKSTTRPYIYPIFLPLLSPPLLRRFNGGEKQKKKKNS